ncbi:MAG: hypothetical protein FWE53_02240 [Firmicutes bacterium]|nr:hypothetical protein [Bacillota bacterium]
MLNKKEKLLMGFIYEKARSKGSCLMSASDLIVAGLPDYVLTTDDIKRTLDSLELDDYIEVVLSDKKGEVIYCIILKAKGEAYDRNRLAAKKNLRNRIIITVALAVLGGVISLLIRQIYF